jgi:HAD superfamily hydrolase (TIGR01509 family)
MLPITGTAFSNFQAMSSPVRTRSGRYYPCPSLSLQIADWLAYPVPKYLAACFDLDGTLIDTTPLHLAAEADALREMGIDPSDPRRPWTFGLGDVAGMMLLADTLGLDADRLTNAYVPRWEAQVAGGARLKPGAQETLTRLLAMKVPTALVTSGDDGYVRLMLESCRIAGYFETTVSMDDVKSMKPHPEPYLTAAERLGVDPARCVGFEDSPAGLASLRSAGMYSVAVADSLKEQESDLAVDGLDRISGKMLRQWFVEPGD